MEAALDHLTSELTPRLTINNHIIQQCVCLTLIDLEEATAFQATLGVHNEFVELTLNPYLRRLPIQIPR